jgi:hypothetical protein
LNSLPLGGFSIQYFFQAISRKMASDYAYGDYDTEHPLKTTPGKEFDPHTIVKTLAPLWRTITLAP